MSNFTAQDTAQVIAQMQLQTDVMQYFALPTKRQMKEEKFKRNIEQSFKLFNFMDEEDHLWQE